MLYFAYAYPASGATCPHDFAGLSKQLGYIFTFMGFFQLVLLTSYMRTPVEGAAAAEAPAAEDVESGGLPPAGSETAKEGEEASSATPSAEPSARWQFFMDMFSLGFSVLRVASVFIAMEGISWALDVNPALTNLAQETTCERHTLAASVLGVYGFMAILGYSVIFNFLRDIVLACSKETPGVQTYLLAVTSDPYDMSEMTSKMPSMPSMPEVPSFSAGRFGFGSSNDESKEGGDGATEGVTEGDEKVEGGAGNGNPATETDAQETAGDERKDDAEGGSGV